MNFQELLDEGIKYKKAGNTNMAIDFYKDAFDLAQTDSEKLQVWYLILHVHTDKMLAILIEIAEVYNINVYDLQDPETGKRYEWIFGTHNFVRDRKTPEIKDFVMPSEESLFR